MFKSKKNQRGALLLIIAVIWVVSAPIIYVGSKVLPKVHEIVQRPLDKEGRGEDATNEEIQNAKDAVPLLAKGLNASGQVVNAIGNIGAPGDVNDAIGTVVTTSSDFVTGKYYDHVMDSPPVASNSLPSDVNTVPNCSSTNLASCMARSSCTSTGGTWRINNTCASSAKIGCNSNQLSDCHTSIACGAAGGKWNDNKCNTSSVTTEAGATGLVEWGPHHLQYTISGSGATLDPRNDNPGHLWDVYSYTGKLNSPGLITVSGTAIADNPTSSEDFYYGISVTVTAGIKSNSFEYRAPVGEKLNKSFSVSVSVPDDATTASFSMVLTQKNSNYGDRGIVVDGSLMK